MNRYKILAACCSIAIAPLATANLADLTESAQPQLIQTADEPEKQGGQKPSTVVTVRTIRSGIDDNNLVAASANMSNQLICKTDKMTGSRIKRHRCLTLAEWNEEKETRKLRSHLARGAGHPPAWRTP
ncbi:MAG: hypothetical protein HKN70_08800 [Gammaproteobacteria bacterium]|nr:hypothetical protein [Gammaproteobacteria bacterium]